MVTIANFFTDVGETIRHIIYSHIMRLHLNIVFVWVKYNICIYILYAHTYTIYNIIYIYFRYIVNIIINYIIHGAVPTRRYCRKNGNETRVAGTGREKYVVEGKKNISKVIKRYTILFLLQ